MVELNKNKIFKETTTEPGPQNPECVTFSQKPDLKELKTKILHNDSITGEDVTHVIKETKGLKIRIFGQVMTKEELETISTQDLGISKQILEGNTDNYTMLTYLFPDVLKKIMVIRKNTHIALDNLPFLTDYQAELLSSYKNPIYLEGVTSLSDNQAEWLSKHEQGLGLDGLTSITDKQAQSLFKHKGVLILRGLTSITDEQARAFSKHGWPLYLDGLVSINNKQAELLSKHKENLSLNGLKSLTKFQAEVFSRHEGELSLKGVTQFDEEQAKILANHKKAIHSNKLFTELIDKYKT